MMRILCSYSSGVWDSKLLEQYTPDVDIYELVSDGKWTIDEMLGYSKFNNDLDGDNKLHTLNDFFGYIGDSTGYLLSTNSFLIGCGINITKADGDKLSLNLMNDRVTEVIDKVAQLVPHESMDDRSDYIVHTFKEDRAIFTQTYMGAVKNNLRSMESDYIILPFPKYDENQEHYYTSVSGGTGMLGIPLTVADPDFTGLITEALAIESYNSVRPAIYETVMENKLLRDEDSVEMYETLLDGIRVEFAVVYHSSNSDIPFTLWNLTEKKSTDLASYINSRGPKALAAYQKIVDAWYD